MKKSIGFFVLVVLLILAGCEKVTLEPLSDIPENLSLSSDIQPIFNANCTSCHGGTRAPDLREGNAHSSLVNGGYVNTGDPESSELYTVLQGSHNSRASEKEKLFILGWIQQGAKNN